MDKSFIPMGEIENAKNSVLPTKEKYFPNRINFVNNFTG
jgi:hypothetical protein